MAGTVVLMGDKTPPYKARVERPLLVICGAALIGAVRDLAGLFLVRSGG
jgi:hypothetical protein